jgi:hypothetical protein
MRTAHHTSAGQTGFWPATRSGRWSLVLIALAALATVLSMAAVAAGQRGGDTFADNWLLSSLALAMAVSVVGALVSGVYSIALRHERSVAVLLVALLGLLGTLFLIGEFGIPH